MALPLADIFEDALFYSKVGSACCACACTGGKTECFCHVLTFPDCPSASSITESEYRDVVKYLVSVPPYVSLHYVNYDTFARTLRYTEVKKSNQIGFFVDT